MLVQTSMWLLSAFVVVSAQYWVRIPGSAVQISAKGTELWSYNRYNVVQQWTGSGWTAVPASCTSVAAAADGFSWIANNFAGGSNVFRFQKNYGYGTDFVSIPGSARSINAISQTSAVVVGVDNVAYKFNGASFVVMSATDTKNLQLAIGENDDIWRVTLDGKVQQWVSSSWVADATGFPLPGQATWVDVQNANRVVVTTDDGNIYVFNGSTWTKHGFVTYNCMQATINGTNVFCVDQFQAIWTLVA